ncbi:hypothetical protein HID58_067227, partial [Brassica napus]
YHLSPTIKVILISTSEGITPRLNPAYSKTTQYVIKLLTAEDNNITDDLQVTLTITDYNQNTTASNYRRRKRYSTVCFENYTNGTYLCFLLAAIVYISVALINSFVQT